MESLAGQLLIAIPELPDQNFFRSVVLILQHTDQGASGVILNRPSDVTVSKVWDEISNDFCMCTQTVNVGGPVEGPLLALHSCSDLAEARVLKNLYVSLRRENLNLLVRREDEEFRIYSGYAGWGPQQLDSEMERGGWLTLPADPSHVFSSPDLLWKRVCENVGHKTLLKPHFGIKSLPIDPSMN